MLNFKKFFIYIFLIFTFSLVNSYAEVVKKIIVEGNERISNETIVIYGDIELGKNYETSDVNLLIKKLYETNFFSNISVDIENNALKIIVKENPIINTIVFDGEKATKFKDKIKEMIVIMIDLRVNLVSGISAFPFTPTALYLHVLN